MKFFKIVFTIACLSLVLTSCDKDSFSSIEDNAPILEVVEEEVQADNISVGPSNYQLNQAILFAYAEVEGGPVINYSLSLNAEIAGVDADCGGFVFTPLTESETEIQAESYTGDMDFGALWITDEGIAILEAWEAAGSDPDNQPDLEDVLLTYDASGMTYVFSNISDTTVDVEVSGEIVDEDGVSIEISGSFTAEINK